jgi:hypothetical protein
MPNNTTDIYNDFSFTTEGYIYSYLECFSCHLNGPFPDGLHELGVVSALPLFDDSLIGVYPTAFTFDTDTMIQAMTCDYFNHLYLAGEG